MTVRVYRSSDAGAPAVRGNTPGDVINLLNKCLVTGYGSKLPAGWSMPFVGTNVAAFQQGAGNEMFLRVDDTSTATSNRSAKIVGYETMSGVDVGSPAPFPTELQEPGGLQIFTASTSSGMADARQWVIYADESFFFLEIQTRTVANNTYKEVYFFGDIIPYKPGDTTHTIIYGGRYNSSPNTSSNSMLSLSTVTSGSQGMYAARSYTNLGGSAPVGWSSNREITGNTFGSGALQYPNPTDGGLWLLPVTIHEPNIMRGIVPGIWAPGHDDSVLQPGDTFDGSGDLAGRAFEWRQIGSGHAVVFETSDTWR